MPESSSSDIMHVSITDHKIGIHANNKKEKGKFLGLYAINNPNPTNLSKAKAYLKRFESFEPELVYLDSALYYLENSEDNLEDDTVLLEDETEIDPTTDVGIKPPEDSEEEY